MKTKTKTTKQIKKPYKQHFKTVKLTRDQKIVLQGIRLLANETQEKIRDYCDFLEKYFARWGYTKEMAETDCACSEFVCYEEMSVEDLVKAINKSLSSKGSTSEENEGK